MKKLFVLTLALGAFGIMSCKKCQTCTISTSQEVLGFQQQIASESEQYCGDEYDDAPTPGTVSQNVGSIVQEVSITCQDD